MKKFDLETAKINACQANLSIQDKVPQRNFNSAATIASLCQEFPDMASSI